MDFKDPKLLILGGVALVAGFFILKNNQGSTQGSPTSVDTSGNATTGSTAETGNSVIGGAYTYLDGSGIQHIVATDPNGNLVNYGAEQPAFSSPSSGQLSTYTGYTGSIMNGTPWLYGGSPNYSTRAWSQYLAGQGLSSTSGQNTNFDYGTMFPQ